MTLTFSSAVFADASAAGDIERGKEIAAGICAGCHNPDGNSPVPLYPILAGQDASYLVKQIADFKGENGETPKRRSEIMAPMAATLSEEDTINVAAFYAQQEPQPGNISDPSLVETGKRLYQGGDLDDAIPACSSCHSPDARGIPPHYPKIAGQHAAYTLSQLQAFRQGTRKNDTNDTMRTVVSRMNEHEMKAVSEYIATLK